MVFRKKLWISLFFVVVWSIWYERNQAVFLNKIINWENVNYLIKLRLGYWVKGWCHEIPCGPEIFAHYLEGVRTRGRRKWCWTEGYNDSYQCLGESGICRHRKNRLEINLHWGDTQFASLVIWTREEFSAQMQSILEVECRIIGVRSSTIESLTLTCAGMLAVWSLFLLLVLSYVVFSFFCFVLVPPVVERWDFLNCVGVVLSFCCFDVL